MAELQLERNGALFGVHGFSTPKKYDGNDIVRERCFNNHRIA